jgi:hypothetical protein
MLALEQMPNKEEDHSATGKAPGIASRRADADVGAEDLGMTWPSRSLEPAKALRGVGRHNSPRLRTLRRAVLPATPTGHRGSKARHDCSVFVSAERRQCLKFFVTRH